MKYLPVLLLSLSISFFARLQAQDLLLKGNVTYASNREAVPYCAIQLKDVALGTVTDYKGNFSITIPQAYRNHVLVFSYVGMERQEIYIAQIPNPQNMQIILKEGVEELQEVIVQKNKLNAEKILKEAISLIEVNYAQSPHCLEAYSREILSENGANIKYSDAACKLYASPYTGEKYNQWDELKTLRKSDSLVNLITGNIWNSYSGNWAETFHDHFAQSNSRIDHLQILDARSNENQSREFINANIEGGPLGLLSKDIVRYIGFFMDKKHFNDYVYEADNDYDAQGNSCIVISFYPKKKPMSDEEMENRLKKKKFIDRKDILAGKIWIDEKTKAFRYLHFSVPPEYKKLICNIQYMGFKHFGYEIRISYTPNEQNQWNLKQLERLDEYIITDTLNHKITPYRAKMALYVHNVLLDSDQIGKPEGNRVYDKYTTMPLYEEPLDYHPEFWKDYQQKYPIAIIPDSIRRSLESLKSLEKQFSDKHIRNDSLMAPIAKIKTLKTEVHQDIILDDYAWIKDTNRYKRNNKELMTYLNEENAYYDNYFVPLRRDQRGLYSKLLAKIPKETESFPSYSNGYYYGTKYKSEKEYAIIYRTKDTSLAEYEVLFDLNEMAEGKEYFGIGEYKVNTDNSIVAYSVNTEGGWEAPYYFKYIGSNEMIKDSILRSNSLMWIDTRSFYYTEQERGSLRSFKVWKHELGTPQANDQLIYHETDKEFEVRMGKSYNHQYVYLASTSKTSSEIRFRDMEEASQEFKVIHPREENHRYELVIANNQFYILSNKNALNNQVFAASPNAFTIDHWKTIIPHQIDVLIVDFIPLKNYYVVQELSDATFKVKIIERNGKKSHYVNFEDEEYFTCSLLNDENPAKNENSVQLNFSSFITPSTYYNYDIEKKKLNIIQQEKSYGIFFKKAFEVERVYATAKDGKKIPITLFYHKFRKKSPSNPLWITGYGSYGNGSFPSFAPALLSTLETGFTYAIAHVRGGNDCGAAWYEDGKMMNKMNTFTDFIACTEYLIAQGYSSADKIVAQGGSAGGLLMGAIANMRPDLYKTIILDVPFVDVINTMSDEKLPLTTSEYEEWGNPNIAEEYRYIKSYSPYDNVKAQNYPNMLFYTGLNDRNVGFWEGTKMVAKLRAMKTDANFIGLKTNLSAGHGGGSGRFTFYKEFSEKLALVLDLMEK